MSSEWEWVRSQETAGVSLSAVCKRDLKSGDHICCYRGHRCFNPHGIYIGKKGCEVIHFHGTTPKRGKPCTFDDFLKGGQLYRVTHGASVQSSYDDDDDNDDEDNNDDDDDSLKRAGFIYHNVSRQELKPGDHIYCYRKLGLYTHHGIYIGEDGCEVIHFHGTVKKKSDPPQIRSCTLDEFLQGAQLRLVTYDVSFAMARLKRSEATHILKSASASIVIRRAKRYLMNPEKWEDYNLLSNNCETFAVYCKTKLRISKQAIGGLLGDVAGFLYKI